jgi:hypothetical protein
VSALGFNPLMDGYVTAPDPGPPPTGDNGGATMGASMGPTPAGQHVADLQGTPPLTGIHNTPLQVAFLGLVALGVIILLRRAGFRFSVAGKIAAGGR